MENKSKKQQLHPNNLHKEGYDFEKLMKAHPPLRDFAFKNQYDTITIKFSDDAAVRTLNHALLKTYYGIKHWDLPPLYLCPPIPGRADYIHYLNDFLKQHCKPEQLQKTRILDIGTGSSCIYPILGHKLYNWSFIGTEIDPIAFESANQIVQKNNISKKAIELRLQKDKDSILDGIIEKYDRYTICMCNPPFHSSAEESAKQNQRKNRNLGIKQKKENLNFGGRPNELWCEGGELDFIRELIHESAEFSKQFLWFSTLISKDSHVKDIHRELSYVNAKQVHTIKMGQGQKQSRFVAWTFR